MEIRRSDDHTGVRGLRPVARLLGLRLVLLWSTLLVGLLAYRTTHPSSAIPGGALPDPNLDGVSHFLSGDGDTVQLATVVGTSSVAFVSSACEVCITKAGSLRRTVEHLGATEWYMVVLDGPRGVEEMAANSGIPRDRLLLPILAAEQVEGHRDGFVPFVPTVVRYHNGVIVRAFAGAPGPLWARVGRWAGRAGSSGPDAGRREMQPAQAVASGGPTPSCRLVPGHDDAVLLPPVDGGALLYDRVRTAFFLDDRTVIVAGSASLAVYDQAGGFVRSIGRQGSGPGELRSIDGAWPYGQREVLVVERQRGRELVFQGEGSLESDGPIAWGPTRGRWPVAPLGSGRWLLTDSESANVPRDQPGTRVDRVQLLVWGEGSLDTLTTVDGTPRYEDWSRFDRDRYLFSATLPFAPSPGRTLVRGHLVAVTSGRDPFITVLDINSGEVVTTVHVSPTTYPPSERERRVWEDRLLTGSGESRRTTEAIIGRIPTPSSRPPHHGAIRWDDARDLLWVPEYQSYTPWADTLRITLAHLELGGEQKILFPRMASVLSVREDAALLLHRSELDEETVHLVPLTCR